METTALKATGTATPFDVDLDQGGRREDECDDGDAITP